MLQQEGQIDADLVQQYIDRILSGELIQLDVDAPMHSERPNDISRDEPIAVAEPSELQQAVLNDKHDVFDYKENHKFSRLLYLNENWDHQNAG